MRMLGVATGNVWRMVGEKGQDQRLKIIKPLLERYEIKAIEFTCADVEEMNPLSSETVEFCKAMQHVSAHFPFKIKFPSENAEAALIKASKLASQVGIKHFVIHPRQIEDLDNFLGLAQKHGVPFVTELEDNKGIGMKKFREFLERSKMNFVYDTGHAEFYEKQEMKDLLSSFSDKICEAHLNKMHDGHAHHPFHKHGISKTLELIADFDIPFMLEEDFEKDALEELEEEIRFVKDYISGIM